MNINGYEIERKFLINYPDCNFLLKQQGCKAAQLSQAYTPLGRVRKVTQNGETVYIKTVKEHITDVTRKETEYKITKDEYDFGIKNRIKGTQVIEKTRYSIPFRNHILEIDVFPFWNDRAFLEIELTNENEEYIIPDYINIIKEVTADKRYRNSSLAVNHNIEL